MSIYTSAFDACNLYLERKGIVAGMLAARTLVSGVGPERPFFPPGTDRVDPPFFGAARQDVLEKVSTTIISCFSLLRKVIVRISVFRSPDRR